MKAAIITVITIFTVLNIILSSYMVFLSVQTAITCKCSIQNIYWFVIFLYFFFSGVFLIYTLFYVFGHARGKKFMSFMISYLVATLVFAFGSVHYSRYLKSTDCNCVTKRYEKLLSIITYMRVIIAAVTIISMIIFGIYILNNK
jgi:hypothetical protein